MSWDGFTWKIKVFFSKANRKTILLIVIILSLVAVPIVAPMLLGPRGDLLALALEWLLYPALGSLIAGFMGLLFRASKSPLRWLFLAGLLLFGSMVLLALYQEFRCLADLLLPFEQRRVVIAKTYYEAPQSGRGAMPESGGWHLLTDNGQDLSLCDSINGSHMHPGTYNIQLSHFKHLVMTADPSN